MKLMDGGYDEGRRQKRNSGSWMMTGLDMMLAPSLGILPFVLLIVEGWHQHG